MKISIVIPVYNEADSLIELYRKINSVLVQLNDWHEIIFVNDGSTDKTPYVLQELYDKNQEKIKIITLQKNFGKTTALMKGFKICKGDVIITMDADLQNDPLDIPLFINKINEGYDFVCGWRFKRKDNFLKVILSSVFNTFLRLAFKIKFHDINCGFKAFQKRIIDKIELQSDEQRFMPILVKQKSFKVTEIKIKHFRRKFNKSKYPIFRFKVLFDLLRLISSKKINFIK